MIENDIIPRLKLLLVEQPGLCDALRAVRDPWQAARLLAQAGAVGGVPTSEAEIIRHVERLGVTPRSECLSEAQLDGIVGGSPEQSQRWCDALRTLLL